MLKSFKYKYVKASSLLESVIAITVLSICSLIAVRIYVETLNSSYSVNYLEAVVNINQLAQKSKIEKDYAEGDYDFKDFKVVKEVESLNDEILKLKYSAFLRNDTIKKEYIIYDHYEE